MRAKMPLQGWLAFSKILIFVGAIVGAAGGLGTYYFSDRIKKTPPEIKVKSIIPVMIYETKEITFTGEKISFMNKGISFVLHVKSYSKPVTISRLKIKGKVFISPNFYLSQGGNVGRNIEEVSQEWENRKPYIKVDWTAFIDEKKSDNTLNEFDDKLICFNLIDPIASGQAESGWEIPVSDYFGYSDGSKEPTKTRTYPEFDFFFKTEIGQKFPSDIRDEIKNGDIQFILIAGSKEMVIPYEYFKPPTLFKKNYWDKSPIEKIILLDK